MPYSVITLIIRCFVNLFLIYHNLFEFIDSIFCKDVACCEHFTGINHHLYQIHCSFFLIWLYLYKQDIHIDCVFHISSPQFQEELRQQPIQWNPNPNPHLPMAKKSRPRRKHHQQRLTAFWVPRSWEDRRIGAGLYRKTRRWWCSPPKKNGEITRFMYD